MDRVSRAERYGTVYCKHCRRVTGQWLIEWTYYYDVYRCSVCRHKTQITPYKLKASFNKRKEVKTKLPSLREVHRLRKPEYEFNGPIGVRYA